MEQFEPIFETLPPLAKLLSIADDIDLERAASKWRNNPPLEGFEAILDAVEAG